MAVKRLSNEKEKKNRQVIKNLKGKSQDNLTSADIKKIVGYLAKKFGII